MDLAKIVVIVNLEAPRNVKQLHAHWDIWDTIENLLKLMLKLLRPWRNC